MIPPTRLVALGIKLRVDALVTAPDKISSIADDADLDEDAKSNFEHYADGIEVLEEIMNLMKKLGNLSSLHVRRLWMQQEP